MTQEIKPRRVWYLVPLVLLLAGGIPAALMIRDGVRGVGSELERTVAPGPGTVDLDKAGRWTVFYEYRSHFRGGPITAPRRAPSFQILLRSQSSGVERTVLPSNADFNYNLPTGAGYSIGYVDIDEPGLYTVEAETGIPETPPSVLAFGHEKGRSVVRLVAGIVVAGLTAFAALLAFALIVFFRSRAKRKIEREQLAYGMPPPPPGAGIGPPPGS